MAEPLLTLTPAGLYCPSGDFYVDPWRSVDRAIVTHGHADHARAGCRRYLTARPGLGVLRTRLGVDAAIEAADYGQVFTIRGVHVSLHPAGHILGSCQVRLERLGEVWVISGDYKLEPDPTCATFEPVRCHTFVTESTFGLPIYRWPPQQQVFEAIQAWWRANQAAGRASIIFTYALGKAQRVLAGLDPAVGPIFVHGAVARLNRDYVEAGVPLPPAAYVSEAARAKAADFAQGMIVAPTSAQGSLWLRRFGEASTGYVSGWMRIRGTRRRHSVDRGFVLSDHADWPGLMQAIEATGAQRVWITHGYTAVLARWMQERGLEAHAIETQFGEGEEDAALAQPGDPATA